MAVRHLTDEDFQRYLDGDNTRESRITHHLRECPSCRQELLSYQQVYKALARDHGFELSPRFSDAVIGRLTAAAEAPSYGGLINLVLMILGSILAFGIILYFVDGSFLTDMLTMVTSETSALTSVLMDSLHAVTASFGVSAYVLLYTAMLLLLFAVLDRILLRLRRSHFCI